jgi:hypothetical protein
MRPSSNRGPEFEQVEVKGGSGSHYWRYKK